MSDCAIETQGLQKIYGEKVVVDDLTLCVPRGEVFGFLGPNGAGKSTSVKMLLGLVRASGGSASVLGRWPGHTGALGRIGFLPEHFRFHEWLHATEFLDLHGRLYGMSAVQRQQRIPQLLDMVGLQQHAHRPLAGFSKGMLQRIGLAQALLNDPDLVFLDEPTSALDPFGRKLVREIIHQLGHEQKTIFLNSHLLSEVEATCDRVAFIKMGRVIHTLTLAEMQPSAVMVEVGVANVTPPLIDALTKLSIEPMTMPDQLHSTTSPVTLSLTLANEDHIPRVAACIHEHHGHIYALMPRRVSLEQRFLDILGMDDSGQ